MSAAGPPQGAKDPSGGSEPRGAGSVGAKMHWHRRARHALAHSLRVRLVALFLAAALLGIDACPMEGISATGYDHVLGLEGSGYATVVACALGYRAADDKYAEMPKARFDRSRVISHL